MMLNVPVMLTAVAFLCYAASRFIVSYLVSKHLSVWERIWFISPASMITAFALGLLLTNTP